MGKVLGTRVDGPLAPYVPGFLAKLKSQHYADWSATSYQGVMAHLSRWLDRHQWQAEDLSPTRIEHFVAERRRLGYAKGRSTRGMVGVLVTYLREIGAAPPVPPPSLRTPRDQVVSAFGEYLAEQRGLATQTITWYQRVATHFLISIDVEEKDDQFELTITGRQINQFLLGEAGSRGTGSFHNVTVALRSLLRFAFIMGWMPYSMAGAVLPAPAWRDTEPLHNNPSPSQVTELLNHCNRNTEAGCRDFAILLLLVRLGLRAGEVARLTLDDIDWRQGTLHIVGKGRRHDDLPLPQDVGDALADYCQQYRVAGASRRMFLHLRAPHTELTASGISGIVAQACRRAGIVPFGAHRLRHRAALNLRQAGAPLWEVGRVLRHRRLVTTAHYAKPNPTETSLVARPWLGGDQP